MPIFLPCLEKIYRFKKKNKKKNINMVIILKEISHPSCCLHAIMINQRSITEKNGKEYFKIL